ncbi:F-box/FBD/LRR-repeat protein [Carex littledalei]|uniref:F-box/FBD/LRR-repeat protein n=1 Tax=Carex littledalei TaxID=544730 RepID=A0A833RI62_9POAL|nr:F-box/FBD/LRR-repeat protein [Carex littledalei]
MEWLDRAALLMPRVISVCIRGVGRLNFPNSMFSCASLENLELCVFPGGRTTIRPISIALPSLKTLKLHFLILDDDFAQKLFLGCPSLKSLNLESCELFMSDISSNVLKKLTFGDCWQYNHMRICCPSLVSLSIQSNMFRTRTISLEKMTSVVKANISLYRTDEEEDVNDLPDAKLFSGLSNATSLKLHFGRHPDLKEQWEKDIPKCRTFKNLKSLEIAGL